MVKPFRRANGELLLLNTPLVLTPYQERKANQYYQLVSPIYGVNRYKYVYAVSITPRGKECISHSWYSRDLRIDIRNIKSVRCCYMFKEYDNTPHMHGVIITNREIKFLALQKKTKKYVFRPPERIHSDNGIRYWLRYIMKCQELGKRLGG